MPAARPTEAAIARAISGAIKGGMQVGVVEVRPDGTIRILPESGAREKGSDVDRWFEENDAG